MKKMIFTAVIILPFILISCKTRKCCDVPPPHGNLIFAIKVDGIMLNDSLLKLTTLSYYNKGKLIINPNEDPDKPINFMYEDTLIMKQATSHDDAPIQGLLISRIVPEVIARSGVSDFYLTYANGQTDTLSIVMEVVAKDKLNQEACQCIYPIRSISYKGRVSKIDNTIIDSKSYNGQVFVIEH